MYWLLVYYFSTSLYTTYPLPPYHFPPKLRICYKIPPLDWQPPAYFHAKEHLLIPSAETLALDEYFIRSLISYTNWKLFQTRVSEARTGDALRCEGAPTARAPLVWGAVPGGATEHCYGTCCREGSVVCAFRVFQGLLNFCLSIVFLKFFVFILQFVNPAMPYFLVIGRYSVSFSQQIQIVDCTEHILLYFNIRLNSTSKCSFVLILQFIIWLWILTNSYYFVKIWIRHKILFQPQWQSAGNT